MFEFMPSLSPIRIDNIDSELHLLFFFLLRRARGRTFLNIEELHSDSQSICIFLHDRTVVATGFWRLGTEIPQNGECGCRDHKNSDDSHQNPPKPSLGLFSIASHLSLHLQSSELILLRRTRQKGGRRPFFHFSGAQSSCFN